MISVTPEERRRAGRAVAERIERLGYTVPEVANASKIDARSLRALIAGQRWPTVAIRSRVEDAIEWPRGEILRQARDGLEALAVFTDAEIAAELLLRIRRRDATEGQQQISRLHARRSADAQP